MDGVADGEKLGRHGGIIAGVGVLGRVTIVKRGAGGKI